MATCCYASSSSPFSLLQQQNRNSNTSSFSRHTFPAIARPVHSFPSSLPLRPSAIAQASSSSPPPLPPPDREQVFFDGGPHIGDLLANLAFGFTLLWLPLTLAAVFRALFLRYRFTNLRVTVVSGLAGGDRKDFSYDVITDVKYVPRFIGEWGDLVISLSDGTKVEFKSIPKFREIAAYCLERAGKQERVKGKGLARL